MRRCEHCGRRILLSSVTEAGHEFCSEACCESSPLIKDIKVFSEAEVLEIALALRKGPCPKCGGPGPIDVYTAHEVWSVVFRWEARSIPHFCCSLCGKRQQLLSLAGTLALGWWSLPGLIVTPVQVLRNLVGVLHLRGDKPSRKLMALARHRLEFPITDKESLVATSGFILKAPPTPPPG